MKSFSPVLSGTRRTCALIAFAVGACTWTLDESRIGERDAASAAGTSNNTPDSSAGQAGTEGAGGSAGGLGGASGTSGTSGMGGKGGTVDAASTGGASGARGATGSGGSGGCVNHQDCPAWVCICADDTKIAGFSCAQGSCRSGDSFCEQLCQDNRRVAAKGCYLQSNNTGGTAGAACGKGDGG